MNKKLTVITILWFASTNFSAAQMFYDRYWDDDDEKMMVMGKWSQLFYEVNIGANVSGYEKYADFIYLSLGYGKPNTDNAWRKFLPESKRAAPTSKDDMKNRIDNTTSGLHAGMIGVGWQHFFTHYIGFHMQAGWAFIADWGSRDDDSTVSTSDEEEGEKSTFIYHSVPVQVGIDFNLWRRLDLQFGATYMWKEIPIFTVGVGVVF